MVQEHLSQMLSLRKDLKLTDGIYLRDRDYLRLRDQADGFGPDDLPVCDEDSSQNVVNGFAPMAKRPYGWARSLIAPTP